MNMLGLAKRCRARFLISSTSEVYGDPLQHPQTEEYWGGWCVWVWGGVDAASVVGVGGGGGLVRAHCR